MTETVLLILKSTLGNTNQQTMGQSNFAEQVLIAAIVLPPGTEKTVTLPSSNTT